MAFDRQPPSKESNCSQRIVAAPSTFTAPSLRTDAPLTAPLFGTELKSPTVRRLLALAFIGTIFVPVSGIGVDLCPLHAATGLPCPGCGMTRALASVWHGAFGDALGLHPFVAVLWPLAAAVTLLAPLSRAQWERATAKLTRWSRPISWLQRVVLFAFFGFGALRLLAFVLWAERFP